MKITKEQKIYGSVLVLAIGAFLFDRTLFQPAPAEAQPAAELLIKTANDVKGGAGGARAAQAKGATQASSPILGVGRGLAQRLAAAAKRQCLDVNCPDDAFALAPVWWSVKTVEAPVIGPGSRTDISNDDRERAADFARHQLDAVIIRGQVGYAIIDKTEGVYVGETFDKFKLVSVTRTSATFVSGPVRVVLRLHADSKLKGDDGVITDKPGRHQTK